MKELIIHFYAKAQTGELLFIAKSAATANNDTEAAAIALNKLLPSHPEVAQNLWMAEGPVR